jgi:hypothetical protein
MRPDNVGRIITSLFHASLEIDNIVLLGAKVVRAVVRSKLLRLAFAMILFPPLWKKYTRNRGPYGDVEISSS